MSQNEKQDPKVPAAQLKPENNSYVFEPVFTYNGVTVPYDSTDYETMQRYEEGVAQMAADKKKIKKDGKVSETVLSYCKVYEPFFDHLFGEGMFLKLCGGKYSMARTDEMYKAFLDTVNAQRIARQAVMAGIKKDYLPNRAARRAAAKK